MHVSFIFAILFPINLATVSDPTCFSALSLAHTWTATGNTQTATIFGCGRNGAVELPCVQGGTQVSSRCINSGGSDQNLLSTNLAVLQATYFRTNIGFCHAGDLPLQAGGTVTIIVRFNDSGTPAVTESFTLNTNIGACSTVATVPTIGSIPNNVVIDELEIQMSNLAGYNLSSMTLFNPEMCSSIVRYAEEQFFRNVDQGVDLPIDPPGYVPKVSAGRLTCPFNNEESDLTCFIVEGDIADSLFTRVPSFWEPREYFGNSTTRGFALQLGTGDLFLYSGWRCFDNFLVDPNNPGAGPVQINSRTISVGGPGAPFFQALTHVIQRSPPPTPRSFLDHLFWGSQPYDVALFMKSPEVIESTGDGVFGTIYSPDPDRLDPYVIAGSVKLGVTSPFPNIGQAAFNLTE